MQGLMTEKRDAEELKKFEDRCHGELMKSGRMLHALGNIIPEAMVKLGGAQDVAWGLGELVSELGDRVRHFTCELEDIARVRAGKKAAGEIGWWKGWRTDE